MFATILIPLDGSSLAEQALPFAERLARGRTARLILTRVVPPVSAAGTSVETSTALTAHADLEEIASRLRCAEASVEVTVLQGDVSEEILRAVAARGADLIVVSTHGRSGIGRWLHGSVADKVIRSTRVPVILVPSDVNVAWPNDRQLRILVPLDGSQLSEAVLGPAMELAKRLGAELLLVEVVAWPPLVYSDPIQLLPYDPQEQLAEARGYLAEVAGKLTGRGARVRSCAAVGQTPAATIVRLARDEHADLIAMATHGRGGLARVVLGSTTTGTLQHAGVPLLIVRPTELQAHKLPVSEPHTALVQA